ncbi:MAG: hypothetical protein K1W24_05610 [Lachnospiraceae bacterium]
MPVSEYNKELFLDACNKIVQNGNNQNGIGTLKEKTLHAVLKNFYEPDTSRQEVKVGRFVADIKKDNEIIEIQTRSFNNMRKKLAQFLELYHVTIVYPIIYNKWLYWINEETGEISPGRKSPKHGSFYDAFYELYKIKPYLASPNLDICLTLVDAKEYRILNGYGKDHKKGSTRYDRIPVALVDELCIKNQSGYLSLLPVNLPSKFSVKDYAKQAHINNRYAQLAINIFKYIGIIEQSGKDGRSYLYSRKI